MNKRASCRTFLLAAPLLLGALIGGVKWKQMHPTATPFDLQERAFLRKAKFVNVYVDGKEVNCPRAEFEAALDDFYLIDLGDDFESLIKSLRLQRNTGSKIRIRACDMRDNEWAPFAEIELGDGIPYGAGHVERPGAPQRRGPIFALLHPVTERRLRQLIAPPFSREVNIGRHAARVGAS